MAKNSSNAGDTAEEERKFGEILKLLRKKKPLNCAVRIGGPAGIVLEADKKKKPPALRKLAKTNGGGPKCVSGVISLQGKVITIETIEEEFPGALPKLMKTYFRDMKQAFRVELVAGSADESGVADDDEDEEGTEAPVARAAETESETSESQAETAVDPQMETASESATDELHDAGVETSTSETPGQTEAPASSARPAATAQNQAPTGRTSEQEELLSGLRDVKALLQQVSQQGRREDVVRMQKFGDLFKKAVKQSDARVGHKVLDGMRQLAKQVDVNAKASQTRKKARAGRLKQMRAGLKNMIRELS